jgi:fructuronate reductase/mannitol 2-dehydrogenase
MAPSPIPLNDNQTVGPRDDVEVPHYDRSAIRPAVVHFGVGGFHRAHQALYFDDIAQQGISMDWGVIGVGMHRSEMKEVLSAQDNLFTIVERDPGRSHARVVGIVTDYLYAPEEQEAVVAALTNEQTKLVTLTLTGASYPVDPHTGEFQADDDEISQDLEQTGHPETVFGYIVEALQARREAGIAPFTVLSCDNVQGNGETTRTAVCGYARSFDEGLADWIEQNVTFPSSMVDRITPTTSTADRDEVARTFGIDDRWPVLTEPFRQWIIEDSFCNDRPPLDQVGAQFVDDVRPFELMKTRLLNGSHCALGYLGLLLGYKRSDEAMADDAVATVIDHLMAEVVPLLDPVPGIDLDEYCATLTDRFRNAQVGDQLSRLARRGSSKLASYVVPSLEAAIEQQREHRMLTLTIASWIVAICGRDEHGQPIEVDDPMLDEIKPLAEAQDVRGILANRRVFDALEDDESFVSDLEHVVAALHEQGASAVLRAVSQPATAR